MEIALSVPCVVRGRVVDRQGHPVAHRLVRALAADKMESFYDPTTRTNADGTFELRSVRAGRQIIEVGPFRGDEAPAGSTAKAIAAPDAPVTGLLLTAQREEPPES